MKRIVRATAVALTLGAAMSLSACGQTGTAAVVDGQTISEDEANTAAVQINEALKPPQPFTADQAVAYLVLAPSAMQYAADHGFPQTESAARASVKLSDPAPATLRIIQTSNVFQAMSPQDNIAYSAKVAELKVQVNPKYGVFDPTNQSILVPVQPNWLTSPAK